MSTKKPTFSGIDKAFLITSFVLLGPLLAVPLGVSDVTPQQSATSSQAVTILSSLTGNFGICNSLPQGWNCGNLHSGTPSPGSAQIVNGVFQSRQSNPGLGGSNDYYYSTTQKGTFPWTPCSAPASGVLPTGITSVSVNFTSLSYDPGSTPGSDRYHIYIALYYWLPNGPVSAGGSTYQCLDTQVRVENVGGAFSSIGSTATYNPGDSFGWDQVTLQTVPGQNGLLVANVADQCLQDLQAWGLPTNTPCQLAGIEIGTEGYQFRELDVNWYDVNLNVGPVPLSTSFTASPTTQIINVPLTFTATTTGGTSPYAVAWNFGDGTTGTGATVAHSYSTAGTFTVTEVATDSSPTTKTATSSLSVAVYLTLPLSVTTFQASSYSPQVGQTVTFTALATGGVSPYTYTVAFGDGAPGTGSSPTHFYSVAGSYTATLTVADSASPQVILLARITVNILANPPTLTVPGNQTVVAGTWITFTVSSASVNVGGTVALSATGLPAGASFNQTTGLFSWKPSAGQTGSYVVVFTTTDSSNPSAPTSRPVDIQVNQAAPGGSNGGSGGSGGSSSGGCLFCGVIPEISTNLGLLVIGGLLGLVASLALLTIKARAGLERTKKRMNRLTREE